MSLPLTGDNSDLHNEALVPASGDEIDYSVKMICDDDVIVISVGMYKFFMAHGKEGMKAKELYEHLVFTSRMQYGSTNVKATANYLMKGLGWGDKTLKKAKTFLSKAGLIEYLSVKDEKTGLFTSHTILVKRMWDESSLSAWLDRKAKKEESEAIDIELIEDSEPDLIETPVDKSSGVENDPVDKQAENHPVGSESTHWMNHPSGAGRQTNKERERETYKREKEETTREMPLVDNSSFSPPAGGFSEIPEMIRYLETVVELDGAGEFFFPPTAKAALEHFSKIRNIKWVLDQVDQYRQKKTPAQIRRFCESDLPKHLTRAYGASPKDSVPVKKEPRFCPVCGALQPDSGTMNYCPKCTFPGNEFHDQVKINDHREWWEGYQHREAAG